MCDISINTENGRFIYRSAGLILKENQVLLITEEGLDFWFLPGGRTQLLEHSKAAAGREVAEELHVEPTVERLLWIGEYMYFLKHRQTMCHNIDFVYLCQLPPDSAILSEPSGVREDIFNANNRVNIFKWFDIDKLHEIQILPPFLSNAIKDLPKEPKYIYTPLSIVEPKLQEKV